MKNQVVASEAFSNEDMHYFFDFMQAKSGRFYIRICRSDEQQQGKFSRKSVVIFEEDFELAMEALASLFRSANFQVKRALQQGALPDLNRGGIKSWPEELRPREKLLHGGGKSLSAAELLALLIGSGTSRLSALDLAGEILSSVNDDLTALSSLKVEELCRFRGMGHAKSVCVLAALELAERLRVAKG